uniref:Uncharacterized protein n=1 Tax=Glossina brevipalpis TaxID=37001 RepID=A0A1A9WD53_9MUSC
MKAYAFFSTPVPISFAHIYLVVWERRRKERKKKEDEEKEKKTEKQKDEKNDEKEKEEEEKEDSHTITEDQCATLNCGLVNERVDVTSISKCYKRKHELSNSPTVCGG